MVDARSTGLVEHMTALAPVIDICATSPDGDKLLDQTRDFLTKYVAFASPEQADAVTLWVMHTHAFAAAETTPRLSIQSAEKQSGKTRLLEVLDLLACETIQTSNISAAALFRLVAQEGNVTLLVDEVDTVFSKNGKGKEDLRGLLNAGYRKGSCVTRCLGSAVERYPVFAPVALAGIGRLPDTVQDRSIVIRMKRREGVTIAKLRARDAEPEALKIKAALNQWALAHCAGLKTRVPLMPTDLCDRAADVWEPLLAIADACGAEWPERGRAAAVALSAGVPAVGTEVGEVLVRARALFVRLGVDRVATPVLLAEVTDVVSTAKSLASCLRALGIGPRVLRDGDNVFRGYLASDFG